MYRSTIVALTMLLLLGFARGDAQDPTEPAWKTRAQLYQNYDKLRSDGKTPDEALEQALLGSMEKLKPFGAKGKVEDEATRVREHLLHIMLHDFEGKPDKKAARRALLGAIAKEYVAAGREWSYYQDSPKSRQDREGFRFADEFLRKTLGGSKWSRNERAIERGRILRDAMRERGKSGPEAEYPLASFLEQSGSDPIEGAWTAYGWYIENGDSTGQAALKAAEIARQLGATPEQVGEFLGQAAQPHQPQRYEDSLFGTPDLGIAILAAAGLIEILERVGDAEKQETDEQLLQSIYVCLRELQEVYSGLTAVLPYAITTHEQAFSNAESAVRGTTNSIQHLRFWLAAQTTLLDFGKLLLDLASLNSMANSISQVHNTMRLTNQGWKPKLGPGGKTYVGIRSLVPGANAVREYSNRIRQYANGTRLETRDEIDLPGAAGTAAGFWLPVETMVRTVAQEGVNAYKSPNFRSAAGIALGKALHFIGRHSRNQMIDIIAEKRGNLTPEITHALNCKASWQTVVYRKQLVGTADKLVGEATDAMKKLLKARGVAVPDVERRAYYAQAEEGWGRLVMFLNRRSAVLTEQLRRHIERVRFYDTGTSAFSDFSSDADGWGLLRDAYPLEAKDGAIKGIDRANGEMWEFNAPQKFLGNKAALYGSELRFQMKIEYTNVHYDYVTVTLASEEKGEIRLTVPYAPTRVWTSYRAPLDVSGDWKIGKRKATAEEIQAILRSLNQLSILGEFRSGADTALLDNVQMGVAAR